MRRLPERPSPKNGWPPASASRQARAAPLRPPCPTPPALKSGRVGQTGKSVKLPHLAPNRDRQATDIYNAIRLVPHAAPRLPRRGKVGQSGGACPTVLPHDFSFQASRTASPSAVRTCARPRFLIQWSSSRRRAIRRFALLLPMPSLVGERPLADIRARPDRLAGPCLRESSPPARSAPRGRSGAAGRRCRASDALLVDKAGRLGSYELEPQGSNAGPRCLPCQCKVAVASSRHTVRLPSTSFRNAGPAARQQGIAARILDRMRRHENGRARWQLCQGAEAARRAEHGGIAVVVVAVEEGLQRVCDDQAQVADRRGVAGEQVSRGLQAEVPRVPMDRQGVRVDSEVGSETEPLMTDVFRISPARKSTEPCRASCPQKAAPRATLAASKRAIAVLPWPVAPVIV